MSWLTISDNERLCTHFAGLQLEAVYKHSYFTHHNGLENTICEKFFDLKNCIKPPE